MRYRCRVGSTMARRKGAKAGLLRGRGHKLKCAAHQREKAIQHKLWANMHDGSGGQPTGPATTPNYSKCMAERWPGRSMSGLGRMVAMYTDRLTGGLEQRGQAMYSKPTSWASAHGHECP